MRLESWKGKAKELKTEVTALYFALGDPRVAKSTKLAVVLIVAYALSPIDLIPDFIPILGYLDDLIILPLAIALVLRTIPSDVLAECRAKAHGRIDSKLRWIGAAIVVAVWILTVLLLGSYLNRLRTN
jgi:uncharacterized membrane protein YkvA (DUF1232 family)